MQPPKELLEPAVLQLGEEEVLEGELVERTVLMLEGELVVRMVLMLEEEVEQVVKKASPFFFW